MDQTQPSDSSVRLHVFHSNNQDPTHVAGEPCAPSNPLPPKTLDNCEVQTNATNGASCHSSTTPNHHRRELRADPWRFVIAPIFCILSISNAMQWIAFSPIVDEVRDFFGMSAQAVNFLATTYVISYVAIVFLSCKLYEVTGIKLGVLIAALANTLGAALKLVALYVWPHAALLYVAQVFNSLTEVLTIATPPLISNRWFPEGERIVANTILSSALNFGCGIGVLIPTFFVGPTKDERHNFGNLFGFHFALCGSVLLAVIFLFPKKPRTSASYMAAHQQGREEQRLKVVAALLGRGKQKNEEAANVAQELERPTRRDSSVTSGEEILEFDTEDDDGPEVEPVNVFSVLMDCFREARQNLSFILLAVGSAAELGLIWAVATVLPQMLQPYGVSEATAGWIGFCNLVLGTVVCPFFMPLVEKYGRRYKLVLCSLATVLLLNMILLTLLLHFGPSRSDASDSEEDHRSYYITIAFICWGGISGLCQNFMMPLMFEYVVELTFPMAESTSAPVLTWSACLSNFLLALIFGEVLTNNPTEERALRVFIGATVVTAIGALALFLTKPSYKRRDYENQQREKEALNTTQATKSLPEPEKITLPDETAQTRV